MPVQFSGSLIYRLIILTLDYAWPYEYTSLGCRQISFGFGLKQQ